MTMHMLPSYFTTTSTRKQKKNNKSKSLIAAEKEHEKFLRRMGIGSRSSVGSEQPPSKRQVVGSSPTEIAKRSVGKSGNPATFGMWKSEVRILPLRPIILRFKYGKARASSIQW
jgi:hypothetical protein